MVILKLKLPLSSYQLYLNQLIIKQQLKSVDLFPKSVSWTLKQQAIYFLLASCLPLSDLKDYCANTRIRSLATHSLCFTCAVKFGMRLICSKKHRPFGIAAPHSVYDEIKLKRNNFAELRNSEIYNLSKDI